MLAAAGGAQLFGAVGSARAGRVVTARFDRAARAGPYQRSSRPELQPWDVKTGQPVGPPIPTRGQYRCAFAGPTRTAGTC